MTEPLIGLFGGTFDPIHRGHVQTVNCVQQHCNLDQVRFIPAAIPPHRDQPRASPEQRLRMVELATAEWPGFIADDRELKRDKPSYTYDTVQSLRQDFPNQALCLIMGMDAMLGLPGWYRWQALLDQVHFLVMNRPKYSAPAQRPDWWQQRSIGHAGLLAEVKSGYILDVPVEPVSVSATQIRDGISQNIDVRQMLAQSVWQYIELQNLYT